MGNNFLPDILAYINILSTPSPLADFCYTIFTMSADEEKKEITRDDANGLDRTLRPQTWDEYIGQSKTKENLRILLTALESVVTPRSIFSFMAHQD